MRNITVEYRTWKAMRWRCSPKNPHRNRYFDRGITVCDRWNDFNLFLEDMGTRPSAEYSLDRIDNERGYSPENCRWATRIQQTNNTGRTNYVIHNGAKIVLMDIVRETGIHPETIRNRLRRGWDYERIIMSPLKPRNRMRGENGQFV